MKRSCADASQATQKPLHGGTPPNAACAIGTQTLRDVRDAGSQSLAHARLKGTVRAAKRKWADEYVEEKAQLWSVLPLGDTGRRPALQSPVATRAE